MPLYSLTADQGLVASDAAASVVSFLVIHASKLSFNEIPFPAASVSLD
jgi:hypothetical protein